MDAMSFMSVHAYCVHACLDMLMHACMPAMGFMRVQFPFHVCTVLRTEAPTVGIRHDLS